jgi:hypothetical protein
MAESSQAEQNLVLRGKVISEDERGNISLDDIWSLAGGKASKAPKHWRGNRQVAALIDELQKKVTVGYLKAKKPNFPVIYAKRGRAGGGTFAHPILAAAYAGYLSPKLEIEVREIWLRYRAGDASLADEILQRASAEGNRWAGTRALARSQRKSYTGTLKAHGVWGEGYMLCTEAVYSKLLGGKSYQLRKRMGLPAKANLRDALPTDQLAYVMAAEALSAERIEEEERFGNVLCIEASEIGGSAIAKAVEEDRRNRQKRLIG